ncbi:MAG TPA: ABC transporter substrate-binding protein [Noviherbaspirillum sp.]|nr:ABC transporter substrate-binding protein [Noviherbaspirillum sp.]
MNKYWRTALSALLAATSLTAAAEEGVTDSSIILGETIGVTGIIAGPVKEMIEGAQAYFATVNKQGGVHGRRIEVKVMDDKFDPATAAANAEALIKKEHVFALFQNRGTPHTEAILPILNTNHVPLIAPSTGAAIFHTPVNHWVFHIRAKYQDEVAKGVEHFATVGLSDIGLLHVDDSFGHDGLEGFNKAMAAHSLKPVIVTKFGRVKPDYDATAAEIIKANPRALIIVSSAKNTIEVIKAIRRQGGRMQIMTLSNNSSQAFVKDLGPAGVGVIVSQITPPPDLLSTVLGQEFRNAAKASSVTVSYAAMEGFVNAKVLVEGLRRAGRNLTREGFIHAMESMQHTDFGGLMVTYGPDDHSGSEFVELTMIGRDGRFVR